MVVDEERIQTSVRPVVEGLGFVVVRVSWGQQGRFRRLRIDVDMKRQGPVPVPYRGSSMTARDLEAVTREVSAVLDAYDAVSGSYLLEVSTPGLDRCLATEQDFRDFIGHPVRIVLARSMEGRRRIQGVIEAIEGEGSQARVRIREGEGVVDAAFHEIQAANLVVATPGFGVKPGGTGRRHKKSR